MTHDEICRLIDKWMADGLPEKDVSIISVHTRDCDTCASYLDLTRRSIQAFGEFSFEISPDIRSATKQLIARRADSLQQQQEALTRVLRATAVALLLAIFSCTLAWRLTSVLAALMHLSMPEVRLAVIVFWLLPSSLATLLPLATHRYRRIMA